MMMMIITNHEYKLKLYQTISTARNLTQYYSHVLKQWSVNFSLANVSRFQQNKNLNFFAFTKEWPKTRTTDKPKKYITYYITCYLTSPILIAFHHLPPLLYRWVHPMVFHSQCRTSVGWAVHILYRCHWIHTAKDHTTNIVHIFRIDKSNLIFWDV